MSYDVALSYSREDLSIARRLAAALSDRDVRVFFDKGEQAKLAGQNLVDELTDVYHRQSRLCVMLISTSYARGAWTNLERQAVQAREMQEPGYLVPVRLDGTHLPGLLPTVAVLHWPPHDEHSIAEIIVQKLGATSTASAHLLKIDDVSMTSTADHMTLDLRLRNAGIEVVNITRADVHVLERDELMVAVQPSGRYQLVLAEEHNEVAVAHALRPGEVDRFLLEVGYTSLCRGRAEIILRYNGDRTVTSQSFAFSPPTARRP